MVFSSLAFILLFLPLLAAVYFLVPKRYVAARKYVLLLFSILFYASGEPVYVLIMFTCIFLTWIFGRGIEKRNKFFFITAIFINLFPLFVFKYLSFIISNINVLFKVELRSPSMIMPIGISFYTFQMLTYIVDLYKGKISCQNNLGYLALYIFLFPQLIAGPIVRYQDIENQISAGNESWEKIQRGMGRFVIGLSKKVLISNQVGYIAGEIMKNPLIHIPTRLLWIAVFAYTMQIYFDFSGYSDMAIGLGNIFGFEFPENFNEPYKSISITEFWRRWHISLGTFFRDYVYIPMGGNRVSKTKWIFNVCIVWLLTGLWHGAAWNFVIWGGYYAVLLLTEKILPGKLQKRVPVILKWGGTFFLVMVGWAIFMCDGYSTGELFVFVSRLFGFGIYESAVSIRVLGLMAYIPFLLIAFFLSTPLKKIINKPISTLKLRGGAILLLNDSALIILFLTSLAMIISGTYNPFIYFRF